MNILYSSNSMLYRKQILAARAILEISQLDLSNISGVAAVTISRIEASEDAFNKASSVTIKKIRDSFIKCGIKFLAPTDDQNSIAGVGVRYFPTKMENK